MESNRGETERFWELIVGDYDYEPPRRGQVRQGVILSISDHDMVVDLGLKRDGVVLQSDLSAVDDDYLAALEVGDSVPVTVTRPWGGDEIIVSLRLGLQQEDWLRAERMVESGDLATCEVVDTNRGGVLVQFGRLAGFVPNSHLGGLARSWPTEQLNEKKAELVGQVMPLSVIEVNQDRRRLVLSRRLAERRLRQELMDELAPGQIRMGVVRNIVSFGAFVDLGGLDGLVHISELAWQHVEDPNELLHVGEEIQVCVLSVDPERQRIGLSRKRLLPDPWEEVSSRLEVGDVLQGTVTSVKPIGIFVDVGQGVRGFARRSSSLRLDDVFDPEGLAGSEVLVRVLNVDPARHQIDLEVVGLGSPATLEAVRAVEAA